MKETLRRREADPFVTVRIQTLLWIGLGLFVLLVGRLYWLQVVRYDTFRTLSENNRIRIRPVRAPRGLILDRKGRAIAETQASFDLVCSPVDVTDLAGEIRLLDRIVEFDAEEVQERIRVAQRRNPYSAVTVARDLRFEQISVLEFNRESLPGFSILAESKRSYPYGTAFAHVLGYVGEANDQEIAAARGARLQMGDIVGKYGLERSEDNVIRGINGGRQVEVDAAGRDKRLVAEVRPQTGGTVRTTLDADLQLAAREAMGDRAGAVVAMAPATGEILAFYSAPAFDPNAFSRGIRKEEWKELSSDPRKPMQNKGLQGSYAPGSTVKPFLALTGLETGKRLPQESIRCGGSFRFGNRVFRCWKEKGHGPVEMYRGIVQSCDVYFYTLGLKVGPDPVAQLERSAGLGTLTGIDLPGERRGLVPDAEWKLATLKAKWIDSESVMIGIGQGYIHLTPLEMLQGYAALATGGVVMRPHVVRGVLRMDGVVENRAPVTVRTLGWKPENVELIRKALWGVVNDYGTAGIAKLPGIDVGGKTGTAQVATVRAGKMIKSEDLPYQIRDHAWFAGFAPVFAPEIAVVALVEHGGHGGSAAAPIVKAVMQEYFRAKEESRSAAAPGAGPPAAPGRGAERR